MRAIWGALLIAALGFGEARAQAGEATFEGWSAVCDDVGECSAWASTGGWAAPSYILLRRDAGGRWTAHFGAMGHRSYSQGALEVKLAGAERAAWTHRFEGKSDDRAMREAAVTSSPDVAALRTAIASGQTIQIVADGRNEPWQTISLSGATSALAWMETRAANPRPPVIRRAPTIDQARLPKAPPTVEDCEAPSLYRLSPGKILVVGWCSGGDYPAEASSYLGLIDEHGHDLPGPVLEGYSLELTAVFASLAYDPKTRGLSAFQPGEYRLGSCGAEIRWVWDGASFRLTRLTQMIDCINLPPALWPSIRRARVIDAR